MEPTLPCARIEPRGVRGRLARLGAELRQRARVAGRIGAVAMHLVASSVAILTVFGLVVWLLPPPHSRQLDDLDRMQRELERSRARMEQLRVLIEHLDQPPLPPWSEASRPALAGPLPPPVR